MSTGDSERATKRPREDEEAPQEIIRSADYWFSDGSIVLQPESTQFRVAKSMLAMHSTVFRDMLSLPPTEEPLVEGCPVVLLPGDKADDWKHLLDAMHPKSTLVQEPPLLAHVCAILRLSKKYDIAPFRRSCIEVIKNTYPSLLKDFDEGADADFSDPDFENMAFDVRIINFAREIGLYSVLPIAFYIIATARLDDGIEQSDFSALGLVDQVHVLRGRVKLTESYLDTPLKWLDTKNGCVPCESCSQPETCHAAASRLLTDLIRRAYRVVPVLDDWSDDWDNVCCRECTTGAKQVYETARVECWGKLPSYFDLPPWDELLRMDLE
ncbi:BTB domain-containing protein [Mycena kentingensis (nom. inval.)]|nr:BTB domain-containing protein [Mycena kentingensis (nom. inval.)]